METTESIRIRNYTTGALPPRNLASKHPLSAVGLCMDQASAEGCAHDHGSE
ncbi:MAG: hypothetical protein U9N46_00470 [Euryarchaeota archaeon]|nr:hypothetical protein [Euryarchaeota archaeon]